MSKNYGKYYNSNKNENTLETTETTIQANGFSIEGEFVEEPEAVVEVVEAVEENTTEMVEVPKVFYGINNCKKLNVRTEPNKEADLVCVLDSTSKFEIEELESEPEWLKVFLENGDTGFCMKMYVAIR